MEDLYCTGGQHDLTSPRVGLGIAGDESTAFFVVDGAADFQSAVSLIEVLPLESANLTPAQASGQLSVEEVIPDFVLRDDFHEHSQLSLCQNLFAAIADFGWCDHLSWVIGDQVSLLRCLQRAVECGVDFVCGTDGQTASCLFVEFLNILRRDPGQLFITQARADVVLNMAAVVPYEISVSSAVAMVIISHFNTLLKRL